MARAGPPRGRRDHRARPHRLSHPARRREGRGAQPVLRHRRRVHDDLGGPGGRPGVVRVRGRHDGAGAERQRQPRAGPRHLARDRQGGRSAHGRPQGRRRRGLRAAAQDQPGPQHQAGHAGRSRPAVAGRPSAGHRLSTPWRAARVQAHPSRPAEGQARRRRGNRPRGTPRGSGAKSCGGLAAHRQMGRYAGASGIPLPHGRPQDWARSDCERRHHDRALPPHPRDPHRTRDRPGPRRGRPPDLPLEQLHVRGARDPSPLRLHAQRQPHA